MTNSFVGLTPKLIMEAVFECFCDFKKYTDRLNSSASRYFSIQRCRIASATNFHSGVVSYTKAITTYNCGSQLSCLQSNVATTSFPTLPFNFSMSLCYCSSVFT